MARSFTRRQDGPGNIIRAGHINELQVASEQDDARIAAKVDAGTVYTKPELDAALAGKADRSSLADVATSGDYHDLINTPDGDGGGGGSSWGAIAGTLADQADLQSALDAKADTDHQHAGAANFSVVVGTDAEVDNGGTAVGVQATAGLQGTAVGLATLSSGSGSTGLGNGVEASGERSIAIGSSNETVASGQQAIAIGVGAKASEDYRAVMRADTLRLETASEKSPGWPMRGGPSTIELRSQDGSFHEIAVTDDDGLTIDGNPVGGGLELAGPGVAETAARSDHQHESSQALQLGFNALAEHLAGTALGAYANSVGYQSLAVGSSARSVGQDSTALGRSSRSFGKASLAIGENCEAHGESSLAAGKQAYTAEDEDGVAELRYRTLRVVPPNALIGTPPHPAGDGASGITLQSETGALKTIGVTDDNGLTVDGSAVGGTGGGGAQAGAIQFVLDGDGAVLDTGAVLDLEVPFDLNLDQVTILGDQAGTLELDFLCDAFASFPPTTSICGSTPPTMRGGQTYRDGTLAGWTRSLAAGSILRAVVTNVTDITRATISLSAAATGDGDGDPEPGGSYADMILSTDGLVAYWRLDETAGPLLDEVEDRALTDAGGGTTTLGAPSLLSTDTENGAVDLSYSSYLTTDHASVLSPAAGDFTLECWVRLNAVSSATSTIVGKASGVSAPDREYRLNYSSGGDWRGTAYTAGGSNHVVGPEATTGITYLAMVRDGDSLYLHVNDTRHGPTPISGAINGTPGSFQIAAFNGIEGADVTVDEVAMYSVALSEATLQAHYAAGIGA